jgi:hypothetical protein
MAGGLSLSFSVLVVPEDPTYDGAILKPLFQRMLAECGRARADVRVLPEPKVQGYEHARRLLEEQIIVRWNWYDVILFCPDRDGAAGREEELRSLEARIRAKLSVLDPVPRVRVLCCAAVEEVEAWLLAGHAARLSRPWKEVRADVGIKERVFQPLMKETGRSGGPDGGRGEMMRETLANYALLKTRCPELGDLESRLRALLDAA